MITGKRVLVVGDVMTDVIVVPDGPIVRGSDRRAQVRSRPGGSGANQAVWLGALSVPVTFAARVGAADRAFYENYFRGLGVVPMLAGDADLPSGVLVTIVDPDGERSFLTDRSANLNLEDADLPDAMLEDAGLLLVSGYSFFEAGPRAAVMGLMGRALARRVPMAVDPASVGFLAEVGAASFLDWTRGADLLLANRDEAELLAGSSDLETQVEQLGARYGTVIVKCGAAGAVLGDRTGIRARQSAPIVRVIDSTGAGDAFAAGYIAAWSAGADIAEALDAAVAAGARAVGHIGGQPA